MYTIKVEVTKDNKDFYTEVFDIDHEEDVDVITDVLSDIGFDIEDYIKGDYKYGSLTSWYLENKSKFAPYK